MGKSKKQGKGSNRPPVINPLGLSSIAELESSQDPMIKSVALAAIKGEVPTMNKQEVSPLINKLQSKEASDRAWAASTVSVLCSNDEATRKNLLSCNVVGRLIELLSNFEIEVIVEALGALRNLATMNDEGIVCDIAKKDIWKPMGTLIEKVSVELDKIVKGEVVANKKEAANREAIFTIAENIIVILWSMGETNDKLLEKVSKKQEIQFLLAFLSSFQKLPINLVLNAARCLLTLSEYNQTLFQNFFVNIPANLQVLENILQNEDSENKNEFSKSLLKVVISGILVNFRSSITPAIESKVSKEPSLSSLLLFSPTFFTVLLPIVSSVLSSSANINQSINHAIQNGPKKEEEQQVNNKEAIKDFEIKSTHLVKAETLVTNHHLILEVLSNLVAEEKSENYNAEEEMEEEMEEEEEEEEELVDEILNNDSNEDKETIQSNDISPAINYIFENVVEKLIELATPHPWTLSQPNQNGIGNKELQQYETITVSLGGLHSRSLAALNNLFSMISEGGTKQEKLFLNQKYEAGIKTLWDFLFTTVNSFMEQSDELNINQDVIDQGLSCLWSLTRWIQLENIVITANHLQFLLNIVNKADESKEKVSMATKAIGTIGAIACRRPGYVNDNQVIGNCLMEIIKQANELPLERALSKAEIYLEALNAMFDIYGDMSYDYDLPNFVKGGYLDCLQQVVGSVGKLTKAIDRRTKRELREHANETLANLKAFNKYKLDELKQYKKTQMI
ncbi:ARM repeat-containing protein [Neoconidiobolus thromboides FSU 785]|nr:ARM repeat-containing protein [Neoconidiobolus thromboides FSU 785]